MSRPALAFTGDRISSAAIRPSAAFDQLRWGLVPHYIKDLKAARKSINARSETARSSGMFRSPLERRRCIVPAEAFYEWRAQADGTQPYAIARQDGAPLAFAGLLKGWTAPGGPTVRSFAILTASANTTMAGLHERMPVILEPADWPVWWARMPGTPRRSCGRRRMTCCTFGPSAGR